MHSSFQGGNTLAITALDHSRFGRQPGILLRALKVEHSDRKGFWLRNEERLHYIYHDFKLALREWRKKNHPDRGGDPDIYRKFNAACSGLERSFHKRGIGSKPDGVVRDIFKMPRRLLTEDELSYVRSRSLLSYYRNREKRVAYYKARYLKKKSEKTFAQATGRV